MAHGAGAEARTIYLPLADIPPTDPSPMLAALEEATQLTDQTCQTYNVITCDQQLCKILVDIKRVIP